MEETVKVVGLVAQERVQRRTAEHIVELLFSQIMEEIVEVAMLVTLPLVQRIDEQLVWWLLPQITDIGEEIVNVEVPPVDDIEALQYRSVRSHRKYPGMYSGTEYLLSKKHEL